MFDFFFEIIQFLSQTVQWITFFVNFIINGISLFTTTFSQFELLLDSVPSALSSLIFFMLAVYLFQFIRGKR